MVKKIDVPRRTDIARQQEILSKLMALENEVLSFEEEADGWQKVSAFDSAKDARTEADNRIFDIILLLPSAEEEGMRTSAFPFVLDLFNKYIT